MIKSHIVFLLFFFIHFHTNNGANTDPLCPIDFSYVETFPWDTSLCHDPLQQGCCQTLRSLFGIGLAQYLKQTSMFYLPNANTSSSCLENFNQKLISMYAPGWVFPLCFNDTDFVNMPSTRCAGILTLHDWAERMHNNSPLESSCNGDLTGSARCSLCMDAGLKVNSYLVSLHPNSTKCFFFAILYAAAIVSDFGPEDVRTASCIMKVPLPLSSSANGKGPNKTKRRLILGFVAGIIGTFFAAVLFVVHREWDRKRKQDLMHENYVISVKSKVVLANTGAKWFHLTELEQATNGFSPQNIIGQGGFGVVYKGTLSNGTEVAVKQILDLDSKGDDEFANEAEIISKIRHKNLLSLRGFCVTSERIDGKRRYLVYDFMSNGSLDDHIFIEERNHHRHHLSWPQRKNITLDIAKGLAYLHFGIKPAIFHRDIKAANILLDSDMNARVADFGLAKQSGEGETHLVTRVAGTHGYLAPEYALYGQLTEKSDVYSFGIVILEIISGRKALDPSKVLITDWAWELLKSGKVEEIFHRSIRGEGPKGVMERFVRVGILCAHVMVALRPTIADALRMLEGDIDIPRLPERPLPSSHEMLRMTFEYGVGSR